MGFPALSRGCTACCGCWGLSAAILDAAAQRGGFSLAIAAHAFGGGQGVIPDARASALGFCNGGGVCNVRGERSRNAALPVSPITFAIAEHGWVRD